MIRSDEERQAAKKVQVARLAVKGSPGYPALYAKQPDQIRIAEEAAAARKIEREASEALKAATLAAGAEAASLWESNDLSTVGA
ncbi:hypothetical protein LCGC14_0491530 [marine sediment metagenome]|uniref:Uncharacterized protein n=1 Tax=marine sediment metagenome TaxID=412755 RepID=A0A0F9S6G9_9ZZZZ